jgi:hypothetical protein
VKVLLSNSVEYIANNYDHFSYSGFNRGRDVDGSSPFKTFEREAQFLVESWYFV